MPERINEPYIFTHEVGSRSQYHLQLFQQKWDCLAILSEHSSNSGHPLNRHKFQQFATHVANALWETRKIPPDRLQWIYDQGKTIERVPMIGINGKMYEKDGKEPLTRDQLENVKSVWRAPHLVQDKEPEKVNEVGGRETDLKKETFGNSHDSERVKHAPSGQILQEGTNDKARQAHIEQILEKGKDKDRER